jgi:hypothetical protein
MPNNTPVRFRDIPLWDKFQFTVSDEHTPGYHTTWIKTGERTFAYTWNQDRPKHYRRISSINEECIIVTD